MYIKVINLTPDQVREWIAYDGETGAFTWKKNPSRRMKAGQRAGAWKAGRDGVKYLYLSLLNFQTPASRVAWLLTYGEWPDTNIVYKDGDTRNLKIANLGLAQFPTKHVMKDGRKTYKMSTEAQRHYGLKRYYGMSMEVYNQMLAAQNGVCAMCGGVETYVPKNATTPKPLSVDHNHKTGQIRGLLCSHCNYVIGFCREDRNVLLQAIAYLDKYAAPAPTGDSSDAAQIIQAEAASEELH